MNKLQFDGPVVLAILDGVGLAPDSIGNAVSKARTPFLGKLAEKYLHLALDASGEAVGLLPGTMGNSEVGHNTMGCGQINKHGIAHIEESFKKGDIWKSEAWNGIIDHSKNSTLHFAGIFSDGGVHSDISELEKMIAKASDSGVKKIRIHCVFDGRDVAPQSEPKYIDRLEKFAKTIPNLDLKIASGGGRMTTVADRYENDWSIVERGFKMFMGVSASGNYFKNANEAIANFRKKDPKIQDQYLPDFVIVDENKKPVGKIEKGDAFVYIDFRADRAIEIAMAMTYYDFPYFDRGSFNPDDIYFAGMTEYNSDTHVPAHQLVPPVKIHHTLHELLANNNVSQLGISETAKFGHITYYFNGDSYEKAKGEEFIEIPSYTEPFNSRPWMKSAEITDAVLDNIEKYKFIRINYPGGDMVGHFAELFPTTIALEAIDLSLARIAQKVDELGGCLMIVADHGNAEELLDEHGIGKTSHSLNKVPFFIYDNTKNQKLYSASNIANAGLSNLASTIAILCGVDDVPAEWQKSLIVLK